MNIIEVREKVHIIERRYFENDPRRHFAGEIVAVGDNAIRVMGYVWVYDGGQIKFVKRPELRERVIVLGERQTINIIPREVIIDDLVYVDDLKHGLIVTDNKNFTLGINEFGGNR